MKIGLKGLLLEPEDLNPQQLCKKKSTRVVHGSKASAGRQKQMDPTCSLDASQSVSFRFIEGPCLNGKEG